MTRRDVRRRCRDLTRHEGNVADKIQPGGSTAGLLGAGPHSPPLALETPHTLLLPLGSHLATGKSERGWGKRTCKTELDWDCFVIAGREKATTRSIRVRSEITGGDRERHDSLTLFRKSTSSTFWRGRKGAWCRRRRMKAFMYRFGSAIGGALVVVAWFHLGQPGTVAISGR